MNASKLQRDGYKRYRIASGPAEGVVIEASTNPRCLPCFRWGVIAGPPAARSAATSGYTLRGLVAAVAAVMEHELEK
jgi:hypothetical protein